MRRATVVLTLALLGALPAATSHAGSLDIRGGAFFPRAKSNLFDDDAQLYQKDGRALKRSDWTGGTGGVQFNKGIADNVELGFSVDVYDRTLHTSYIEFVSASDREIQQSLRLNIVPVGVSLRFGPTRRGQLSPYLAIGGDLLFYRYEEFGDFIDFNTESRPVINDSFVSKGVAPGFHVAGGIRVPISDDFGITAEGRYQWAKDDMGDDFRGNKIDLTGASATVGLHIRF